MATHDVNLAEHSGQLLESHRGYDPRLIFFYFVLTALLVTLGVGLGYQQLQRTGEHNETERQQSQRRIVVPGPRGNIVDRNGRLLVGNRPRFSVRLQLDTLRSEMYREAQVIRKAFRDADDADKSDLPTAGEVIQLARLAVVQRYLDQVNAIIGRQEKVNATTLRKHFSREMLLPFTLIDDLQPAEYARLLERLPVNSPAQLHTMSTRYFPYGSSAAHTLGYVGATDQLEVEALEGDDLKTFRMKGTVGRDGVEKKYDSRLQGEAGGAIFRVDHAGNRINPAIRIVPPRQGGDVTLALDIDLQRAAEQRLAEYELAGAAVALDVATGEVLALASKPDYDLGEFGQPKVMAEITEKGAWVNRATQGTYMPGSSFKILVSIAGLRAGLLNPEKMYTCNGVYRVGNHDFPCHDRAVHGAIDLTVAVQKSCNVFFYQTGLDLGAEAIAAEARRFHLDVPTGIDLPQETRAMMIPTAQWKKARFKEAWTGGDTANMSIGQGAVTITPLQMACFAASVARNELWTQPYILHEPGRPAQRTEPIGLTDEQRALLLKGMEMVTQRGGTAHLLTDGRGLTPLPMRIAGKTGTAQKDTPKGKINFAWFIGFAPLENPQIAVAVAVEGDTPGEETGGGRYAGPVAHALFKAWLAKKPRAASGERTD
jgi:penicillin-binding protein 2